MEQRITILKLGGVSAEVAHRRLCEWSALRQADNPNEFSSEQWPDLVRKQVDDFSDQLREHGIALPVVHFVEWTDMWSMGDLFARWMTPPNCPRPISVYANRFQVFAYSLPDNGRLAEYLDAAGPQQFTETDYFIARLREAVVAWQELVERATIVVLRYVIDGSVSDEEITASLRVLPDWLA